MSRTQQYQYGATALDVARYRNPKMNVSIRATFSLKGTANYSA